MIEEWRIIPSFPDYAASSLGQIKRIRVDALGHKLTNRPLKWSISKSGYAKITLCRGAKPYNARVNRAVCEAFQGAAPSPRHHAAHNDGNRLNNRAENLRWAEGAENERDKLAHGTAMAGDRHWSKSRPERRARGIGHGRAKLTDCAVRLIRADSRKQREIAADHGVSQRVVWMIKTGKTWRHVA